MAVLIIGTLDTKGPEIAYLRDRICAAGIDAIVADSGILGEPLGIDPDVTRAEVAVLAGTTIDALRRAGSRGEAVHGMLAGLRALSRRLLAEGKLQGVVTLGGAEGAVLGAHAMMGLPIGVPKLIVTPIASGHRRFGPLVGTKDVMVMHSVIDILGLNPISRTIFDNVAAAMAGMARQAHPVVTNDGQLRVGITMLGNTTRAVMAIRDHLASHGVESIIFHSNGVGGPAMEELAADGLFTGVIDFTTDELADELVGGFHAAGPSRLRAVGALGLPQVVVPGCIDFTVHGRPDVIPPHLRGRPIYTHNPEFTLVRTLEPEMRELGRRFAERLNEATGPVAVMVPTGGLSIPSRPGQVFWNPEADAAFTETLRDHLRRDIPVSTHPYHINDPEFAQAVAHTFLALLRTRAAEAHERGTGTS
jgi:uncharacterized protein (UPF0261 family)